VTVGAAERADARERTYMARALALAERGACTTDPNPRVGCVLVREGEIVGEGYHRRAGEPHAERHALTAARERARGAVAYVTLEPCCHFGRTPPCTEALIEAGVARVVAAMLDPNPLVRGRGLERLASTGIAVDHGMLEGAARALNPGFVKRMERGLPYLRCKLAMSLDGRTAMASGESRWITGAPARRDVHRLRARSSAILTGLGTVLADDPELTVRLAPEILGEAVAQTGIRQPLRVVLDPALEMSPAARLLAQPGSTLVLCSREHPARAAALTAAGARVVCLPGDVGHMDLEAVLRYLAGQEVNEVLLEAGATLSGAAVRSGLVDELVCYLAPHLMGGGARPAFHLPDIVCMAERIPLEIADIRAVGADWRITARPRAVA
jgi:diaminohydroxyphosphoribosylaminopyrimidine deaminase / 5-amino-6-(5-phosphoribosylamino)uracil reductase